MGFFDFLLTDEERLKRKVQSHILRCHDEFLHCTANNNVEGLNRWLDDFAKSVSTFLGARILNHADVEYGKTDGIFASWFDFEDGEALLEAKRLSYNAAIGELLVADTSPLPPIWSQEMCDFIDGRNIDWAEIQSIVDDWWEDEIKGN